QMPKAPGLSPEQAGPTLRPQLIALAIWGKITSPLLTGRSSIETTLLTPLDVLKGFAESGLPQLIRGSLDNNHPSRTVGRRQFDPREPHQVEDRRPQESVFKNEALLVSRLDDP